ncbi:hypothetical protein [Streptomyces sp. NPDC008001]
MIGKYTAAPGLLVDGQAVDFADQIVRGDVTKLWSPDANEEQLEAARR